MKPSVLVVCSAPVSGTLSLVGSLAADFDHTIAADGGARVCAESGVRPDFVVGDLDSLERDTVRQMEADGVPFKIYPADKDESDLDLAITQARVIGVGSLCVTAAFSGRLEHTLAAVGSLGAAADLRPRFVEPQQEGWVLDPSAREVFSVEGDGTSFSVTALVSNTCVSIDGARWTLDHASLPLLSSRGVSNVSLTGGGVVRVHTGTALVICAREARGS